MLNNIRACDLDFKFSLSDELLENDIFDLDEIELEENDNKYDYYEEVPSSDDSTFEISDDENNIHPVSIPLPTPIPLSPITHASLSNPPLPPPPVPKLNFNSMFSSPIMNPFKKKKIDFPSLKSKITINYPKKTVTDFNSGKIINVWNPSNNPIESKIDDDSDFSISSHTTSSNESDSDEAEF